MLIQIHKEEGKKLEQKIADLEQNEQDFDENQYSLDFYKKRQRKIGQIAKSYKADRMEFQMLNKTIERKKK